MERLSQQKRRGLSKQQLLFWGMLFLLAGMIGRGFLQNRVLQMSTLTPQQLLEVMSASGTAMAAATAALVMQALETCGIPVFAFLLADSFHKTKDRKRLFLLLILIAALSEIPYNLAMGGKLLDTASRNPAIGMVLGMVVLLFFRHYSENSFKNVLIKIFVGFAAVLWSVIIKIDHGVALLVVTMVMWSLRNKGQLRTMFGAVASTACALVSPFYLASAMGVLPVHLFQGEEEEEKPEIVMYLAYPILLLAVGLLTYMI